MNGFSHLKKKYGPSITSGKTDAKLAAKIVNACVVLGSAVDAKNPPIIREKQTSVTTIKVVCLLTLPNFLSSVFRWGFQWGILSRRKWLVNAKGIEISGFGIFVAIAAPTATWGVSSMPTYKCY